MWCQLPYKCCLQLIEELAALSLLAEVMLPDKAVTPSPVCHMHMLAVPATRKCCLQLAKELADLHRLLLLLPVLLLLLLLLLQSSTPAVSTSYLHAGPAGS
jgi:hypothetical protein